MENTRIKITPKYYNFVHIYTQCAKTTCYFPRNARINLRHYPSILSLFLVQCINYISHRSSGGSIKCINPFTSHPTCSNISLSLGQIYNLFPLISFTRVSFTIGKVEMLTPASNSIELSFLSQTTESKESFFYDHISKEFYFELLICFYFVRAIRSDSSD